MNNDIGIVSCNMIAEQPRAILVGAKAAGLASVEWFACRQADIFEPATAGEIAAMARSLGMRSTYHAPYEDAWNPAAQPSSQRVAAIVSEMALQASRLEADLMTLHMGRVPDGADRGAALERVAGGIGRAARRAADLGVRISVENMPVVSGKSYLGDTPEDFDVLFGLADSPAVGMNMDFGHAHTCGNLGEWLARHGRRLTNTHVHDNDGSADQHQPVGQGTIDWAGALGWMTKLGYRGPFNIEFAESKGGFASTIALIRAFAG